MRLTLRTLLAYLDDRLSPVNAREIGKKLKDSAFALDLADRIRTVICQRRLTTPGRKVKVIDPNLIAEYLDDQLTPELVSLIEKEILVSDFSLAEVAASHEIIGLLGDPVDLEDRLRVRLIRQNPHRSHDESTDHEFDQITEKSDSDAAQDVWKPLAPQRASFPRSPALILAVLLIGWIALLVTDPDRLFRRNGNEVASSDADDNSRLDSDEANHDVEGIENKTGRAVAGPTNPEAGHTGGEQDPEGSKLPDSTTGVLEPVTAFTPQENQSATSEPDSGPIPARSPEPRDRTPIQPNAAVADGDVPPAVSRPDQGGETGTDVTSATVEVRQFSFTLDDPDGMLLSRAVDGGEWTRAAVVQGDGADWHDLVTARVLALPEPFTAKVTPADAGWSTILLAPCLVQFDDGVWPELRLIDGRCVIDSDLLSGEAEAGVLRLHVGGITAQCSLNGDDVRLGVWVIPATAVAAATVLPDPDSISVPSRPGAQPTVADVAAEPVSLLNQTERLPLDADVSVSLFVAGGSVQVQPKGADPIQIGKGQVLRWTTATGRIEGIQLSDQGQLDAIPDWVYTAGEPAVPEIESAKSRFAAALKESDATIDRAQKLCGGRNPLLARYAASVLSVSREIDVLVQVLLQTDEEQVRIEAIRGLRTAAAQTLPGRQAVLRALGNRLPTRDLDYFVRLLPVITRSEAQQEDPAWLVTMLRHDRAPIRQMAFMILHELTGQTNGYHPDSDTARRNDSVRRWERLLEKNDSRILSPE